MIRHIFNIIFCLLPPTRFFSSRNCMLKIAGIRVGSHTSFCGRSWIYGRGKLTIGNHTWIGPGAVIFTNTEAEIFIGNNCDVGPGVEFITGSHRIGCSSRRAGEGYAKSIIVGDGVWIGAKSVILGGVTIGAGSVIAAGSLVRVDVPNNCLVAGVPGVIKQKLGL